MLDDKTTEEEIRKELGNVSINLRHQKIEATGDYKTLRLTFEEEEPTFVVVSRESRPLTFLSCEFKEAIDCYNELES